MRISLTGGSSDLPIYQRSGLSGSIISFSIPYRVYCAIHDRFLKSWVIQYSEIERVDSIEDIKHNLIREALKFYDLSNQPLEIHITSDLSAKGTGLGGSSALICALSLALRARKKEKITPMAIFQDAIEIEINRVGAAIGIQDHIAAVSGGVNMIGIKNSSLVKHYRYPEKEIIAFNRLVKEHLLLIPNSKERTRYLDLNREEAFNLEAIEESTRLAEDFAKTIPHISYEDLFQLIQKSHTLRLMSPIHRPQESEKIIESIIYAGVDAYQSCGAGAQGFYLVCVRNKAEFKERFTLFPALDVAVESDGVCLDFSNP